MTDKEALVRFTDELGDLVTKLVMVHSNMLLYLRVPGEPIPVPVPTPPPIPTDPKPQPTVNPFEKYRGLELMTVIMRMARALTKEELELARLAGVIFPDHTPTQGDNSDTSIPRTGFALASRGNPVINHFVAHQIYSFTLNITDSSPFKFKWGEVSGSDSASQVEVWMTDPTGKLVHPVTLFPAREGSITVSAPIIGIYVVGFKPKFTGPCHALILNG